MESRCLVMLLTVGKYPRVKTLRRLVFPHAPSPIITNFLQIRTCQHLSRDWSVMFVEVSRCLELEDSNPSTATLHEQPLHVYHTSNSSEWTVQDDNL